GDTLEIEFANYDCDSVSPIIVDSICQIEINEEYFDVQHLSYFQYWPIGDPSKIKVNETIIEKIGRVEEFLFKPICQLDTEPWEWLSLRCYKEGELIFRSDEWDSFCPDCSCDTLIDGSTGVVKYKHTSQFLIYPNPCQDWIIIEHPISIIKKVLLYNSTGQLIEHREPKNNFLQLNIGMQEEGIYYLIIESENLIELRMLFKL
ncbi:MAG: T9SS type A sorting domain-containing protein, partial [Bacteroidales bacterium]|nr:T9SS type A sorting domain-containing protein [Bacteroidales bacterium]